MARIENVLKEYTEGKFDIIVPPAPHRQHPLEFSLRIEVEDQDELLWLRTQSSQGSTSSKESIDGQTKVLRRIIGKSYPEFNEDQINKILSKEKNAILLEVQFATQIVDKEVYDALQAQKKRELEKFKSGSESIVSGSSSAVPGDENK